MAGYEVTYVSPRGVEYVLHSGRDKRPFIEAGTLSGFVGVWEDSPFASVGVPGARVDVRDRVVQPMTGSFTVVVFDRAQWADVRRDFSSRVPGTLVVDGQARFELPVRLSEGLPVPGSVPGRGARLEVVLVADGGVWLSRVSGTNTVTVTNWGDVPVWPEIVWDGAGGPVVLPSGAGFPLPAVTGEHRLSLGRWASGRAVNVATGETVATDALGEMVPVGATRRFTVPDGARLEWEIGVFDPWI